LRLPSTIQVFALTYGQDGQPAFDAETLQPQLGRFDLLINLDKFFLVIHNADSIGAQTLRQLI